jgi:hypothetical protein
VSALVRLILKKDDTETKEWTLYRDHRLYHLFLDPPSICYLVPGTSTAKAQLTARRPSLHGSTVCPRSGELGSDSWAARRAHAQANQSLVAGWRGVPTLRRTDLWWPGSATPPNLAVRLRACHISSSNASRVLPRLSSPRVGSVSPSALISRLQPKHIAPLPPVLQDF